MLIRPIIRMRQVRDVAEPDATSHSVWEPRAAGMALVVLSIVVVYFLSRRARNAAQSQRQRRSDDTVHDIGEGPMGSGTMLSLEKLLEPLQEPKLM